MKQSLSEAEVDRAVATACALMSEREGDTPHDIIDELIGLDAYRRFMRCPDTEMLAAYAEESLPFEEMLRVGTHENRCPVCASDIADLRDLLRQQVTQMLASMPAWTSPFVGREAIRETLTDALSEGSHPLLTLTAPAGTGKTRLTLETAVEYAYLFPDGVWYVPGLCARDTEQAATEIARAARLPLNPKEASLAQLRAYLEDKRALLVLEDVPAHSPATRVVADLMGSRSELCCLTTAMQPLAMPGERTLSLPPMQTSPKNASATEDLLAQESLQLFLGHVHTFLPDYRPEEADVRSAAELCARAEGLPLGIELTAARMHTMSPQEMLERMEHRETLDSPDASLASLVAWTYDLLPPREQALLQRLSVFAESFGVEQAAAICEEEGASELLANLHRQALLQRLSDTERVRYCLLAPIKRFAAARLGNRTFTTQKRFMAYFLQFAQQKAEQLEGAQQVAAMADLSTDLPNLRTGMEHADERNAWQTVGGYGLALRSFLTYQGLWQECDDRLRRSIEAFERAKAANDVERARLERARLLTLKGDYPEAEALFGAVVESAASQSDLALRAQALRGLGNVAQFQGDFEKAETHFAAALRDFEAAGNRWGRADVQNNLGWLAYQQGDKPGNLERARALLTESLAVQRERGDRYRLGHALACLGNVAFAQGRMDEAQQWFEESLQVRQELGDARGLAGSLNNMGMFWQARGDYPRAAHCYDRAARALERLGDRRTLAEVLVQQGELALARDDLPLARERFEICLQLRAALNDASGMAEAQDGLARVTQAERAEEEED